VNLQHVTAPTQNEILAILSVAELKKNQRIFSTAEDDLFLDAILSAYYDLDGRYGWLNRSILTQTWALYLPALEDGMELPLSPVQSITSITYRDTDNAEQTLAATEYDVTLHELVPRVTRAYGKTWPSTYSRPDAVKITYVAGWGNGAAVREKAEGIRRGMILLGGHYYQNREQTYKEPRLVQVNRMLVYGVEEAAGKYRIAKDHG
jgi:uncharacterized phiE125 gp8 family phage protein